MKYFVLLILVFLSSVQGWGKADAFFEESPGPKIKRESTDKKQIKNEKKSKKQDEYLENRYDVPKDTEEEEKFNLNGSKNP